MICHPREFICDFCPKLIENDEDGFVIFGSVCVPTGRGLKALIGEVLSDININTLGRHKTCICVSCFKKKFLKE